MGKKCVPGLICIENMTLFILFIILILIIYLWYSHTRNNTVPMEKVVLVNT